MIVRIAGEGQYRVDDETVEGLNVLDNQTVSAVEAGDEEQLRRLLEAMAKGVRDRGDRLDDAELATSELIVPPPDLTLDEARELFQGEGLIPDLPG